MNICLFEREEISKPLKADDPRAVHIKKILHKGVGDSFAAGIIEGPAGTATITSVGSQAQNAADDKLPQDKNAGDIVFTFEPQSDGKPLFPLHMIIGFPRPIQLKRLLRDMAALGVASVRLCGTELGEKSYLKASLSDPKEIYKMLLDGTVQAASAHVPKPCVYQTLASCLDSIGGNRAQENCSQAKNAAALPQSDASPKSAAPLLLALDNVKPAQSLGAFLQDNPPKGRPVFAAIGSERGWSPAERALLEERGFVRLGMGNRVMRTETAATVSASLILSQMGALG